MPFTVALSTAPETRRALDEVRSRASAQFPDRPDLALVFFSPHHRDAADTIAANLKELNARCLVGSIGEAIVGNDQEIEHQPALSLWLGRWNRSVGVEPFLLELEQTSEGPTLLGWPDGLAVVEPAQSALLLIGDPFSFPADLFLEEVNEAYRGLRVVGGMASGVRDAGECRLIVGDRVVDHGAAGVLLQGPLAIRTIVSQGCRPIGRHMVITRARENIIAELGGKPPLLQLQELWRELPTRDQELIQRGLHVGRVINEYQGEFQRGDFLVRNVLGVDQESGALAITDRIRVGQTVQFQVRDAETADEDLHALLQLDLKAHAQRPAGALLFTCNGRGTRLFPEPNHDAQAIRAEAGAIPLAGFFAAGELGPVGGQNFIHGFTASVVLFED
jgi:small ligand-binding sensory domain FIST